jgi:ABC-type branched-subunit amino acid transport system permease subunit
VSALARLPRISTAARVGGRSKSPSGSPFWPRFFCFPRALLINEILLAGLFALSLDLVLGYAGVVSLG